MFYNWMCLQKCVCAARTINSYKLLEPPGFPVWSTKTCVLYTVSVIKTKFWQGNCELYKRGTKPESPEDPSEPWQVGGNKMRSGRFPKTRSNSQNLDKNVNEDQNIKRLYSKRFTTLPGFQDVTTCGERRQKNFLIHVLHYEKAWQAAWRRLFTPIKEQTKGDSTRNRAVHPIKRSKRETKTFDLSSVQQQDLKTLTTRHFGANRSWNVDQ